MLNQNTNSWAHKLKNAISLPEHIAKYCQGTITGNNFHGDHGSKHESEKGKCLHTYNNGTRYKCFHCGEEGDVISFEMNYHGYTFGEACRALAEQYGIELPVLSLKEWTEEEKREHAIKRKISDDTQAFMNEATLWYHERALANKNVMAYYTGRGITVETIKELKLGYAPGGNKALYKTFKGKYSLEAMLGTGLIKMIEQDDETYYIHDHFRDRYTYPYWNSDPSKADAKGKLLSNVSYMIGGRTETTKPNKEQREKGEPAAKYIKTCTHKEDNPQIHEGVVKHILWNQSALQAKDPKPVLITEGIVDAILARQEFEKYAVVSPVTAKINNEQISFICKQISSKTIENDITICNDVELNQTGKKRAYDNLVGIIDGCYKIRIEEEKKVLKPILEKEPELTFDEQKVKVNEILGEYVTPNIKVALLQKPPGIDKIDLADYLERGKKREALFFLDHARTKWEFEMYLKDNANRFFDYGPNLAPTSKFNEPAVAIELLTEGGFYCTIGDTLYQYENGVYVEDKSGKNKKETLMKLKKKGSNTLIERSIKYLKDASEVEPDIVTNSQNTDILNVKNGLLDLRPLQAGELPELLPHDPYHISFAQLPVVYDPKCEDTSIDEFFLEVLEAEDVMELYKMIGMAIMPSTAYQKAALLYGEGRNGKSVTLDIIEALIGEDNCSSKSLKALETDKFATSDLYGKLACIQADIGGEYLPSNEVFKALVSGDRIDAQRKYGHSFQFKPYATLFFSANNLPKTADKSDAAYRRWQFFGFDRKFVESGSDDNIPDARIADPHIKDKLLTDVALSGLLNSAIAGWLALEQDNGFKATARSTELKTEYKEENNPLEGFCNRYLEKVEDDSSIDPMDRLASKTLCSRIQAWYKDQYKRDLNLSPQKINRFIKNKFSVDKKQRTVNGKTLERWNNLIYSKNAENELDMMVSNAKNNTGIETDIEENIQL